MNRSVSYASYLASRTDSQEHAMHVLEFRDLAVIIAQEQIEDYMPRIEALVNNTISNALSSIVTDATKAINIDVKRIVDITCKEAHAQFHSEEVSNFIAETLQSTLEKELKNIDVKLIIS